MFYCIFKLLLRVIPEYILVEFLIGENIVIEFSWHNNCLHDI